MVSSGTLNALCTALHTSGLLAIIVFSSGGASAQETGLYPPGLSDSQGFGLDVSVSGSLGRSSTHSPPNHASPLAQPTPAESSAPAQVQLFGSSDRLFGIELRDRTGEQRQRIRIAVPLLD